MACRSSLGAEGDCVVGGSMANGRQMPMTVRVKICGITSVDDAEAAVEAGADALGLVFYVGSPRCVTLEKAAEISAVLPVSVARVGVFVDAEEEFVGWVESCPLAFKVAFTV
jgi:hypothetical protein